MICEGFMAERRPSSSTHSWVVDINSGNNEFPEVSGNNEFPEVLGNNEFPEVSGNNELPEVSGNNEFLEVSGNNEFPEAEVTSRSWTTHSMRLIQFTY